MAVAAAHPGFLDLLLARLHQASKAVLRTASRLTKHVLMRGDAFCSGSHLGLQHSCSCC